MMKRVSTALAALSLAVIVQTAPSKAAIGDNVTSVTDFFYTSTLSLGGWIDELIATDFSTLSSTFFTGGTTAVTVLNGGVNGWVSTLDYSASTIQYSYSSLAGNPNGVGSVSVPGPIAGAGLPALLALGGVAAFMRRRKAKALPTAAA